MHIDFIYLFVYDDVVFITMIIITILLKIELLQIYIFALVQF